MDKQIVIELISKLTISYNGGYRPDQETFRTISFSFPVSGRCGDSYSARQRCVRFSSGRGSTFAHFVLGSSAWGYGSCELRNRERYGDAGRPAAVGRYRILCRHRAVSAALSGRQWSGRQLFSRPVFDRGGSPGKQYRPADGLRRR